MANRKELIKVTKARLKSANTLIAASDWHGAAYMLGYVLECALKATVCKTLHLVSYPENTRNIKIDTYFMTHRFEELLLVSGLEDIFSARGPAPAWQNWSNFVIEYTGDWTSMRYDINRIWTEAKIRKLLSNLVEPKYGIISIIKDKKRW